MSAPRLDVLPDLTWTNGPGQWDLTDGVLTLTSAARVDWINYASAGGQPSRQTATSLGFVPEGDFQFSARVQVPGPRTTFDAGVLTLWADADHWAKLCFEYSPQGEAMVVSVVTNGYSDDANSWVVDGDTVHLRISRIGPAYAMHASSDGDRWDFVRVFRLATTDAVAVGMLAQAPTGDSGIARFSDITFTETTLAELRDGS